MEDPVMNIVDDDNARAQLINNYIPWSKQGKKKSLSNTRFTSGGKRPTTAALNKTMVKKELHEDLIKRFNETNTLQNAVQRKKSQGPPSSISAARSIVSRITNKKEVTVKDTAMGEETKTHASIKSFMSQTSHTLSKRPKSSTNPFSRTLNRENMSSLNAGRR
jgi:uncharacterized protein YaiL (DUF2058 family)